MQKYKRMRPNNKTKKKENFRKFGPIQRKIRQRKNTMPTTTNHGTNKENYISHGHSITILLGFRKMKRWKLIKLVKPLNRFKRKRAKHCDAEIEQQCEQKDEKSDGVALVRAISQALLHDDVKSFQSLLTRGIVPFTPETLDLIVPNLDGDPDVPRPKYFVYLQRQLALHHHLPSLTIREESFWEDLKASRFYLTSVHIDQDKCFIDSKYDDLLECPHLCSVDLWLGSNYDHYLVAPSASHLLKALAFLPSLKSLSLTCYGPVNLKSVFERFASSSTTSALCSSSSSSSISSSLALSSFPKYQHLQSLTVEFDYEDDQNAVISFIHVSCPHLTELRIVQEAYLDPLTAEEVDAIASLPLRSLSLNSFDLTDEAFCKVLASHAADSLSCLQSLHLGKGIPFSGLSLIARSFPLLTSLALPLYALDDYSADFHSIADHFTHLTYLSFPEPSLFIDGPHSDKFVTSLSRIHSLITLELPAGRLTSAIGAPLASMNNLTSLSFDSEGWFGSKGLSALAKSTSLRRLSILKCTVKDDGLTSLAKLNHSLTDLDISSKKITDAGLFALIDPNSSHLPLYRLHLSSPLLTDVSCAHLSQNEHITDLCLGSVTREGILSLSHMPQLMSLDARALLIRDYFFEPFLKHPHLQQFEHPPQLPKPSPSYANKKDSLAFELFLLRKKVRRQVWQRICCLIAFERANSESALRHTFLPFVESRYWHHPNNTFSPFIY